MCGQAFLIKIDPPIWPLRRYTIKHLQLGHLRPRPTLSLDNSSPEFQDQEKDLAELYQIL